MSARWPHVKALFQATVERPPQERAAFLAAAVDGDDTLRQEVEALLASDTSDVRFLEGVPEVAWDLLDEILAAPQLSEAGMHAQSAADGEQIGPYRIVGALGVGGMGEVYRARDSKLEREVALKILPAGLSLNADRLSRFRREAQMLAALNHPNIAAIYGLEESHGQPALVLELVEGRTLAERISAGPLPVDEVLIIARQIAGALEAAHLKGIIHRDLKPANIKITPAGVVKVLDFGLAKAADGAVSGGAEADSPIPSVDGTRVGTVVGTASYMSPEQASGQPVDRRTDIWAFGCVLFEMLTGSKAFAADTAVETIATILDNEPPLDTLGASVPPRVARALARCLEKDQTRRISDIAEMAGVIDDALVRREGRRRTLFTVGAIGLAATLAAAAATYLVLPDERMSIDRSEWVQLTNLDSVTQPALSPDGRMLAFIRGTGTFTTSGQIFVKRLPDGEPVPLTNDSLVKMGAVFSPGGDRVAYTVRDEGSWDTWIVPALRGEPRRWLRNASGLTWIAPHRLLFSEIKTGEHMAIVTSDEPRVQTRDVYVPKHRMAMAHRSSLSPGGDWALVVEMDERGVWLPCRLVPIDGRSLGHQVGPVNSRCTDAAWSPDGRWMYLSVNAGDGFHIWRQPFPVGEPEQMTSGPTEEEGLAIAPDGKSLVTSVGLRQRSVWVSDSSGERQISLEGYAYWPLFSADGTKLTYRVSRSVASGQAPTELWVADLASGRSERIFGGQMVTAYDLSGADQVVASVTGEDGTSRLWLAWIDGREPARPIPGVEGANPRFGRSNDVFYLVTEADGMALSRVRLDGTGHQRVTGNLGSVVGTISPDGEWVSNLSGGVTSAVSTTSGTRVPIVPGTSRLRWSPDGNRVYVAIQHEEASAFGIGRTYVVPLEKGSVLPPAPPGGFRSEAELAAVPGVEILPYGDLALGPTPGTYAYSRTTTTRNLYRIPLP